MTGSGGARNRNANHTSIHLAIGKAAKDIRDATGIEARPELDGLALDGGTIDRDRVCGRIVRRGIGLAKAKGTGEHRIGAADGAITLGRDDDIATIVNDLGTAGSANTGLGLIGHTRVTRYGRHSRYGIQHSVISSVDVSVGVDEQGSGGGLAAVGSHGGARGNGDRRTKFHTVTTDVSRGTTAGTACQTSNDDLDVGFRRGAVAVGLAELCFL